MAYTRVDLGDALPLLTSGKVRDLYEIDPQTLLFVVTDRISAYDVSMENVRMYAPVDAHPLVLQYEHVDKSI